MLTFLLPGAWSGYVVAVGCFSAKAVGPDGFGCPGVLQFVAWLHYGTSLFVEGYFDWDGEKTKMTTYSCPKYGSLESVRLKSKMAYDLVNSVSIKFGSSITWNSKTRFNCINRQPGKKSIYFRFHSNKFVPYLEFMSEDVAVLQEIKQSFSDDFVSEVVVKEGLL